ncbi:unnamed protein product, partial [Porites evermanni]
NTDKTNQAQRPGRPAPVNKNPGSSAQQNRRPSAHEVLREKNAFFDPKALKSKDSTEIVHMLNEGILHLKFLLRTKDKKHNNDEFICDLTSTLGKACSVPPGENLNKILATLKGSAFFNSKIPSLLDRLQESTALNDQLSQQRFIEHLIEIFMKYLTHLPSSYADLPYVQLKAALDQSSVDKKEELQAKLDEFKQARNDVIRGERQRDGKRFVNRAGEKPPNDFRDMPICPETKEITSQERSFLRKNISKGRYDNAEHYLDVQFRLLREDFLEPLREGIREIVLNIPRHQRKQLMKNYRSCSGEVDPPEYLRRDKSEEPVYYDLCKALQMLYLPNTTSTVPVLRPEAWPSDEGLPLNKSQLEALKTAITTEFSVIQGPPGTGKTYVGAKIVRCLLDNRRAWDPHQTSPMLMVCYTNHALDQFLEKVLEFLPSRKIIRVGGRSKSDKLQNCNLKKFTYRYRLNGKREEVREKLRQNDKEMKMLKQQLAKADHKLLDFEDVEQLINPAHLQQLCNAKFPSKVANESRTPSNTFKLWLCNNKEMACNQKAEAPTHAKCVESEEKELFYDPTMFTEPQDGSETSLGEPLAAVNVTAFDVAKPDFQQAMKFSEPLEPLAAVNVSNEVAKADLQQKISISEQREVNTNFYERELLSDLSEEQRSTFLSEQMEIRASQDVSQLNNSYLEHTASKEGVDFIQGTENLEVEGKPSDGNADKKREADEETIAIEREADLIQQQRWIEGDEDLLLPISKETCGLMSEEQQKRGTNKANDEDEWTLVTHKKKGQSHFWMPNDADNSKEDGKLDEETEGTTSSKRKKKRRKKNKKTKVITEEKGQSHFWTLNDGENSAEDGKVNDEETRETISLKKNVITEDINSIRKDLSKREMMSTEEAFGIQSIWDMSQSDRLRLYLFWIENYREHCRVEIHHAERAYEQLCEELKEVQFEEDEQVIRQATVVGMTTSGAARYHSVLQRIAPKIVVIEEAAEVMEAHIITSLSHNTKHTILIGDHKQLRPKATVYELAQKYNLEVSLFERMVLNSMDCKRLSIQHRMRPEIATLTKRIYDHEIVDHDSVCNFPPISGLCHNLFFIDHCQPEKLIGGLQSYSNHHEAEFLVALCEYLLLQGYERKQITILTMYTGQLLLLQEKMPRRAFEGIKVCAVDNFQGEENDIILLSLVRSNSEGRIGFLGDSNRICVALSRARQGFYCIGNFNLLTSQCKLWKEICDDLKTKEAIGDNLQLICKRHNNVTNVRWARELKQCELGGCTMPCGDRLECGHACEKLCHVSYVYHVVCYKMCFNSCPGGHKCHDMCHYPRECPKCPVLVRKTPACGHEQSLRCSVDPDDISSGFKCEKKVIKILPCGHNNLMKCYKDPIIYSDCTSSCTKVLDCGHTCSERCTQECQCATMIEIQLPCNHRKQVLCREKNNSIVCKEKCERALNCGHACPGICHEECARNLCKIEVLKDLPCGHQKIVRCYQDPRNVFCSSLCQKRCQRDHPCQRQCHFGSPCYECTVPVNATFPTCGHNVKVPCFINPASLTCNQPCERLRVCGHPCKDICGIDCETRPCQAPVTRLLSCKHVVPLACHKNTETFICKTKVEVLLPCGHKTWLECHVVKAGFNDALCIEKVGNELRCGHKVNLPQYCFQEKVEITLFCGHKKFTTSSRKQEQFQSGRCNAKVKRRLPCGHEKEMQCSDKADRVFCDKPCERILPCKHPCGKRCGDDCASFRCVVEVKKVLSCGRHDVSCLCSEDVSQRICSNPCTRSLSCGHQCPGKCYEICSEYKCQMLVVKNLPCAGNHFLKMFCKDDPNIMACRARCDRKLECGHRCPGFCSQACGAIICRRKVVKEYGCGHKQQVRCFERKTVICKAPCARQERCTHKCKGFCGEPCSKYSCQVPLVKTLPCGHKVKMPCSFSVDDVQCPASCQAQLPCGHECTGTCWECKQRGTHEICQHPCSRVLVCSHRCQATCGRPCPPCVRKCSRRCPHSKCPKECLQPCRPCIKPCTWICPHYQCNNPCGEECDRPRCDAPCPKKLPCRHPCIGLCGENCPTVCAICHSKKLSSMIGQGNFKATEGTRYLQLLDCGHIVKVQEMDEWMLRDMGSDVNHIQCPRCSTPITFSYRYGNIVKRTLRSMENVKNQIREIGNETTRFTRELLGKLRLPPKGILTLAGKLSGLLGSTALYNVQMHHIPFVFSLRNSLLIIHQIEKAFLILQAVGKCQDQLQVTDHSRAIKDALEKISDYLTTPQFDLATLRQLYEHTRTFTIFASILEAQCQVITCGGSFSSTGVSCLKNAQERFELFIKGNSNILQNDWLEKIAASLRNEVGLLPLPPEEPKTEFKNFPGYNTSVWKLCKLHGQVYLTTSFMREGENVSEINGCRQCDGTDDTDENSG